MARMDNNLEFFRGQIEETLGRVQQGLGSLQGPRGTMTTLSGRQLELRGRARQSMARVRMGFDDLTSSFRNRSVEATTYTPWIALALGLGALAIFSPRTFNSTWNWLRNNLWGYAQQVQQSPMAEEARRAMFGGQTNR